MLKSITLKNYKCFKDETTINISPLTVLCGVNSSGKSSILKSLLMLKQSYENDAPYNEMTFNGRLVDNGYFDDVIYHEEKITKENMDKYKSFSISNTFSLKNPDSIPMKTQDIQSFKELKKIFFIIKNIDHIDLKIMLNVARNQYNIDQLSYYAKNNKIRSSRIDITLYNKNNKVLKESYVSISNYGKDDKTYILTYGNIPVLDEDSKKYIFHSNGKGCRCTCYFSNMHLTNIYKDKMDSVLISAKPSILSLFNIASWQYEGIEFIAPLRQQPQRNYVVRRNVNSVGIDGTDTPLLLAKMYEEDIITDVFINNVNDKEIDNYGQIKEKFNVILQQWLNFLQLGKLSIDKGSNGIMALNISEHNITDVGFGVSQVLPTIVQGLYMYKEQTLLLEQPEIHLHPKMQMNLADFLIYLAKSNRNVIVETHSDHLINRILKNIMMNPGYIKPENPLIRIIFIDPKNSPLVKEIKVDKYKGVINGDENFFTQFGTEMMEISKIGLENYKRDKRNGVI